MTNHNLYIIIGAQRSGTTYLYTLLEEHPEICMAKPLKPEPKFFLSDEFYKGRTFYFEKYYSHRSINNSVFIEKSTSYYEYEVVPKRISEQYKNSKILFILRDPIQRALSNYFFSKNNKIENRTLEEVFLEGKPEPKYPKGLSTNPFDYLKRGEYINYINMYLKYIPSSDFKIIFFQEITDNIKTVQDFYSYLGVNSNFIPGSFKRKINQSQFNENIPIEVKDKLINYYKPFNKKLEHFIGKKPF